MQDLKKTSEQAIATEDVEEFTIVPSRHKYSLCHIMLFISFVLSASASFRCASRVMEIVMSFLRLPLSSPSWFSGRLWLLRLGYYKFTRPKKQADDWAWIIDHTIQLGSEKCLVILGVRLSSLPYPDKCLSHEDVEPIALFPVKKSNGEVIYQQLKDTIEKKRVYQEKS